METKPALTEDIDIKPEIKGNGNMKRKHADASSDDENDFLGFDLGKLSSAFKIFRILRSSFNFS